MYWIIPSSPFVPLLHAVVSLGVCLSAMLCSGSNTLWDLGNWPGMENIGISLHDNNNINYKITCSC